MNRTLKDCTTAKIVDAVIEHNLRWMEGRAHDMYLDAILTVRGPDFDVDTTLRAALEVLAVRLKDAPPSAVIVKEGDAR